MHKLWQQFFFSCLFFLFFVSLFLRIYQIGTIPSGLYWDEVAILIDARSILETGKDMHGLPFYQTIFPSYGDYKLPVYIWLTTASAKLIGSGDLAVRIPNLIAGILTIFTSGFIIKLLLEEEGVSLKSAKIIGLSTALVVATSPWSILFSRTGFEAHVGQFFLSCSVLLLLMSKKHRWLIFISPIFGLLATYSYFSVRFVWIGVYCLIISLFFVFSYIKQNSRKRTLSFKTLAVTSVLPVFIFILGLVPMLKSPLYEASNTFRLSTNSVLQNNSVVQSNIYREKVGNTKIDRFLFHRWWLTGRMLLNNYADNMSLPFLFVTGDPNLRHGTGQHGLFFLLFLPFFAIGWYILLKGYHRTFLVLLGWWMMALLPASVPNTTPHALRSLNALVPLSSVIGVGLAVTFLKLKEHDGFLYKLTTTSFLLLLFVSLFQFGHFYFSFYPLISKPHWQGGFKELSDEIFMIRRENEPVYIMNFDDRFYLWLLAYGPYHSGQIQSFPHKDFQIRTFDNIYTEGEPLLFSKSMIVVGSSEQVAQFINNRNYLRENTLKVKQSDKTTFEVVKVSTGLK